MRRTRHLLLVLAVLLSTAAWAQPQTAGPVVSHHIEESELPQILARVYDHWEKDLLPMSQAPVTPVRPVSDSSSVTGLTKIAMVVLLLMAGFMVLTDTSVSKRLSIGRRDNS